jgi:hypothetical protein
MQALSKALHGLVEAAACALDDTKYDTKKLLTKAGSFAKVVLDLCSNRWSLQSGEVLAIAP